MGSQFMLLLFSWGCSRFLDVRGVHSGQPLPLTFFAGLERPLLLPQQVLRCAWGARVAASALGLLLSVICELWFLAMLAG